ncbi:U32 family peptidase [Pseudobacteriovorax antillogorgiicola]|uniref:U32 family peptidase n=1 Tax=Pseudobacteriovorax antillogorgiicola TaxID=1513793 RepID=UPI00135649AC|nr:U32 family peptidase [Pseudobacteriovorax antillogorgiicola]
MTQRNEPKAVQIGKVPEILAPAGGRAQFFAALNAGADAVYLGLKEFNARGRAENFSIEDLEELVPLAKDQGMKVLVTLNILLKDIEFDRLIERLSQLQWVGIHAVIIQDLGVARIVRDYFPSLRMHASTQMAVHNVHGVRQAKAMGFQRVVVARELTIQELKLIHKELAETPVEIEAFCHGSLCYSYSGLCFFSGAEDARSGNRGECAYTCRKPYKILNEPGHGFLFSMKDLNSNQDLERLVEAQVDTLKIEGRKKDAQYVATVVGMYRKRLNEIFGRNTAPQDRSYMRDFKKDMAFSFHRDTTSFFMNGRYHENVIDLSNPTHRGLEVGKVSQVKGRQVVFDTMEPIERFDGLRIDPVAATFHAKPQHGSQVQGHMGEATRKYENKICQFSVRDMYINGKKAPRGQKRQRLTISLPDEVPLPKVGDPIFKTRSNELKRVTEALAKPREARLMALKEIDLDIFADSHDGETTLRFKAHLRGQELATHQFSWPAERPKKAATLEDDLKRSLSLFGDFNLHANLSVEGDLNWFLPRSQVKRLKQDLGTVIQKGIETYTRRSIQGGRLAMSRQRSSLPPALDESYTVKIDRMEYMDFLVQYKLDTGFSPAEIIFEPKRAFLSGKPQDLMKELWLKAQHLGTTLRLAIPTVLRAWDEAVVKRYVSAYWELGGRAFDLGNVGAKSALQAWGYETSDMVSDFTLYSLNTAAVEELGALGLKRVCLSVEDDETSIMTKLQSWPEIGVQAEVILYKDTPLFIAEACSLTALHHGCPTAKVCGYRTLEVENDEGEQFLIAHESCKSIVYGKQAYSISHYRERLQAAGVGCFRIDFLTRPYDQKGFTNVLNSCLTGSKVADSHAANYSRELL